MSNVVNYQEFLYDYVRCHPSGMASGLDGKPPRLAYGGVLWNVEYSPALLLITVSLSFSVAWWRNQRGFYRATAMLSAVYALSLIHI